MRIRSIKPEFWSSEDIAQLDVFARLLFIGMWSYVDDNGVGRDIVKLIVSNLFPLEGDVQDIRMRTHGALNTLHAGGLITRYTVDNRPFLFVTRWTEHQRINRPSVGRYPLPTCGNATFSEPSVSPQNILSAGAGSREQGAGDQGAGDQGDTPDADASVARNQLAVVAANPAEPAAPTTRTLIGEWIDHCDTPPPGRVKGQIAKELKQLIDIDHIPYDQVRQGLSEWSTKDLHPSTLASVVHGVGNRKTAPSRRQTETDQLFDRAMQRAQARSNQ